MRRSLLSLVIIAALALAPLPAAAQSLDPAPPAAPVKLIFIHHSTGENWLSDGYGNLGLALAENNYFVSDTNYGWGPDSIGDRTDIPNWPEWFAGENSARYLEALFNESDQHAAYTRTFADPGGENEIVLFKSCFPNSALEGSPNDAPDPEGWLSVGHAKWVYNEILPTFAAHPDKLFVVITAPPLSDPTYAGNARAFNNWLLNDWLAENNYSLNNVAVFDFYNVLTSPQAHHRLINGAVEHTAAASNTLAYPSGDDHPSEAGSQKATDEFVPLLNGFYNRWREGAPLAPPPAAPEAAAVPPAIPPADPPQVNQPAQPAGALDGFESAPALASAGWEAFWDEATATQIQCRAADDLARSGAHSLFIQYAVAANSWATCGLAFDQPQDWSAAAGVSFYLHAPGGGQVFNVDLYAGSPDNRETYLYTFETPPPDGSDWLYVALAWEDFHRAGWEESAGAPFANPAQVLGFGFGFDTFPDTPSEGQIWIDDLELAAAGASMEAAASPAAPTAPAALPETPEPEQAAQPEPRRLCAGSLAAPLAGVALAAWGRRRLLRRQR